MLPLSSCKIKLSVVSQCRILVAVQYMNTQLFTFFFRLPKLHLLDCSKTWSLLTLTDTVLNYKHKFTTDSDSNHTVHWVHSCTLPTNSTLLAAADVSTMAEQLHPQPPSHGDIISKKFYLLDFKKLPKSEQHWHSGADIEGFICCKLKIINKCTFCLNIQSTHHLNINAGLYILHQLKLASQQHSLQIRPFFKQLEALQCKPKTYCLPSCC